MKKSIARIMRTVFIRCKKFSGFGKHQGADSVLIRKMSIYFGISGTVIHRMLSVLRFICTVSLILFVIYLVFLILMSPKIGNVAINIAKTESKQLVETYINKAVSETTCNEIFSTVSPVDIIYDSSGKISSLKSNTAYLNMLKSEIGIYISKSLSDSGVITLSIPAGSLFDSPITAGRGFRIPIKVLAPSSVRTETESKFSEAGINQTCHRIYIKVSVEFTLITPVSSESFEIDSMVCISETIIVGAVPSVTRT